MTYTSLFKNSSIVLSKAYLCMNMEWTGRLSQVKLIKLDVVNEVINLKGNTEKVAFELVKKEDRGLKRGVV